MKKIFIYMSALVALSTSCSDAFFETSPATKVTTEEVYSSVDNIDAVINGAIRYLLENTSTQANPGLPAIFLTHEVMGEDAFARDGRYGFRDSYPYRDPFDNNNSTRCKFIWSLQYTSIDHANNIIDKVNEANGDKFAHIKGQGYALRAYNYLNLVRQYQFTYAKDPNAKAVPIYIAPTTPATEPKPRATVKEVYDLIIGDLTEAERLLSGFKRAVKNRPDLNVVYGLFARAYLTLEQWELAAQYAAKARDGYPIMEAALYEGFNDVSNKEWIWGHPQTPTQNRNGYSYHSYIETTPYTTDAQGINTYYGYNSIIPDPHFIELFEEGDIRKSLFEIAVQKDEALYAHYRYKKFHNKYPNYDGHIVLMRSSEMLLIEAESKARLNDAESAVALLNELRAKRNLADLSSASFDRQQLLDEILLERRRELWGEGIRFYDILRLQTAPVRRATTETFVNDKGETVAVRGHWFLQFPDGSNITPNSRYFIFPIPITELQNNPNLDK